MSFIGYLYGSEVHTSMYCGTTSIKFTRKQTRKFTNTRWVKKYLKKYSYEFFTPGMVQYHNKIIMHPAIYKQLMEKADELGIQRNDRERKHCVPTIGMGGRQIIAQPY